MHSLLDREEGESALFIREGVGESALFIRQGVGRECTLY